MFFWNEELARLDTVLQTHPDRAVHEATGTAASRREILTLVDHLASVLDDGNAGS